MDWVKESREISEYVNSFQKEDGCKQCDIRVDFEFIDMSTVEVTVVVPRYLRGETCPDGVGGCWGWYEFTYQKVFSKGDTKNI